MSDMNSMNTESFQKNPFREILPSYVFPIFAQKMRQKVGEAWEHKPIKKLIIEDALSECGIDPDRAKSFFGKKNRVSFGYYQMIMREGSAAVQTNNHNHNHNDDGHSENGENHVVNFPSKKKQRTPKKMVSHEDMTSSVKVPEKDPEFIRWGHHNDIKKVLKSGQFFPIYISGMSGTGKTMMIKNVCAELGRPFVRVQFTPETNYEDLIGSFRLGVDEDSSATVTEWVDGPVITAMKTPNCVLLLDELDRSDATGNLALQGMMEGNPILIQKTGEVVEPADGFTVIATGNTKGKSDETGRYNAAQVIDEAFLERFVIDLEQDFPPKSVIKRILERFVSKNQDAFIMIDGDGKLDNFVDSLAKWGEMINKSFKEEVVDDIISIRRLVHALKTFGVFGNELKAIKMTTNRFDDVNKEAFIDLFKKIHDIVEDETANNNDDDDDNDDDKASDHGVA